ncbi:metallophosphoesterase [uncultured Jatrophihabitans sp.]|uniref:metallophosphoesterase n=1 Tax=uncultured Jatrophihabitans sp. TaxID=1610747 RepID=UPI0035CA14E5
MTATAGGRVAVIGDVGGHRDELTAELRRLGADPDSGRLPADLTVVQVGDLVHRGPDSDGVVALVDAYLGEQPAQWVQLVGNHEAQYLRPPVFDWPERIGDGAIDILRAWWAEHRMVVAAAIDVAGEQLLVTHAGLTAGYWRAALDAPSSAVDAARALNSFPDAHGDVLFAPGHMLSPRGAATGANLAAGPVWAAAATELVPSWLAEPQRAPFGQVHGHSAIADRRRRELRAARDVAALVSVDEQAAHETVVLPQGGARIVGVDPGHGRRAHRPWRALVLADARILEPRVSR